jgi:hypothetical protein
MLEIPPGTLGQSLHKIFNYSGPNFRHILMCRQMPSILEFRVDIRGVT